MSIRKPDPIDIQVGQRIRVERTARSMSQETLANQIGVTFQQLQKYEKGLNRVGAGRLTRIAMVLGVPVSTFFSEVKSDAFVGRSNEPSPLELLTNPGSFRLLRAFARLPDTNLRTSFIALIERVADRSDHRARAAKFKEGSVRGRRRAS